MPPLRKRAPQDNCGRTEVLVWEAPLVASMRMLDGLTGGRHGGRGSHASDPAIPARIASSFPDTSIAR